MVSGDSTVRLASFVGRGRELAEIGALLTEGPLLTLTGTGGSGKTRLASEAVPRTAAKFPDGSVWVDLAGLSDPNQVGAAVALAAGVRHVPTKDPSDVVAEHLHGRQLLLVLDNCEHVVDSCAALVGRLVRSCPDVVVLATSRERLAIDGEVTFDVPPLSVPDRTARSAAAVMATESARLFEARARQVRPDFEVTEREAESVAEICRRVDGIPLAIELAAARTRVLAPQQIADGLTDRFRLLAGGGRDAPERHRTVEASITWSYDLLDDAEQLALARLSVFAGGFDLDDAAAVTSGDGIDDRSMLDVVTSLADRSLVEVSERSGRARYRLLGTIRAYARDRLEEVDDPSRVRDRHLDHYVRLAGRAGEGLAGADATSWMVRLADDHDDLHAAIMWALESHRTSAVLDIVGPTIRHWFERGVAPELRGMVRSTLDAPRTDDPEAAHMSIAAAMIALREGDRATTLASAEQAITLARAGGADAARAHALALRAWTGFVMGSVDGEELKSDIDEAVEIVDRLEGDDAATCAYALIFVALLIMYGDSLTAGMRMVDRVVSMCEHGEIVYHAGTAHAVGSLRPVFSGDVARARWHGRRAVELSLEVDRHGFAVYGLTGLAAAGILTGDEPDAHAHLDRALEGIVSWGLEDTIYELVLRPWLVVCALRFGDHDRAVTTVDEFRSMVHVHDNRWDRATLAWLDGQIALGSGRLDEAQTHFDDCLQHSTHPTYPFLLGRSLLGIAHVQRAGDDHERARESAHGALEVFADHGDRVGAVDTLEILAGLAPSTTGRPEQCLRLLAAADRFREETGIGRFPIEADRYEVNRAWARSALSAGAAAEHATEGAQLSVDEAIEYVRRGRGERGRPSSGWESLTPVEHDAARLVAAGLTNAEIGERMFVSMNTVKKYLSQTYAKLGLDGRAALAAEVARRDL